MTIFNSQYLITLGNWDDWHQTLQADTTRQTLPLLLAITNNAGFAHFFIGADTAVLIQGQYSDINTDTETFNI